jgi:phage-related protein
VSDNAEVYGIHAVIDGDDTGFQAVFDNVNKSLGEWGFSFDSLYAKGSSFFKGFGIDVDAFASKLGTNGPMLTAAAGAGLAVAAVGKAIFDIGVQFDEASSLISKGTGATGEALDELNNSFEDLMGSGIEQGLDDVAKGFAELNTKLGLTGKPLEDLTKKFADYADVTQMSVYEATQNVTDVMNKWNISVAQSPILLDQLAKASQMSGASAQDLTDIVRNSGAQLQALGLSLTDSIALFAAFEKGGVNTSSVMKGLQSAINAYTAAGVDASTALEETFQQIEDAKDPMEALSIATEVFGAKAGTEMANALRNGSVSIEEFKTAIREAGGTVEATAEASDTIGDKWAVVMNKVQAAVAPIGGVLVSIAKTVVEVLSDIITAVNNIVGPIFKFIEENFQNLRNVFESIVRFIGAVIKGDWKAAWTEAQLIVLYLVKNIMDGLSALVNGFIGTINNLIDTANKVLDVVGVKIEKIAAVSLSTTLGIDGKIKELNATLATTTKKQDEIGVKTVEVKDKTIKGMTEISDTITALTAKSADAREKDLERQKAANIKQMQSRLETIDAVLEAAKDYDDQILATHKESLAAQEAADVAKATKEKATKADITAIHKYYAEQITLFEREQVSKREALQKEYTAKYADETAKKAKAVEDAEKKSTDKIKNELVARAELEISLGKDALERDKKLVDKRENINSDHVKAVLRDMTKIEKAEIDKAKALGKTEEEIAIIHNKWEDQKVEYAEDAALKHQQMGLNLRDAWKNTIDNMKTQAQSWNELMRTVSSAIKDNVVSALENVGEALVNGTAGWKTFAKAALEGVASILDALAKQLAAIAITSFPNYAMMALAGAGAIAAAIGAGAVRAWANSLATGSDYTMKGRTLVGETGPEIVDMPQGAKVYNANETRQMMSAGSGESVVNHWNIQVGRESTAYQTAREIRRMSQKMAKGLAS